MSVYIRGMEMPKCCAECVALHDNGNSLTCLITHESRGYMFPDTEERMSNCPLIPVPEHGELIEREPILDVMRKERDRISETYGPNDEYVNCLNKYAISMVTSAKTIIPASGGKEYERQ